MMEAFMSNDLWQAILAAAPAVGSIIGMIVVALTSIKQVLTAINQFKSSDEYKKLLLSLEEEKKENRALKKMHKELLSEMRRIKGKELTDDGTSEN